MSPYDHKKMCYSNNGRNNNELKEAFDSGGPLSGLRYVWYRFWPVVHLLSTPAYLLDKRAAPDLNSIQ